MKASFPLVGFFVLSTDRVVMRWLAAGLVWIICLSGSQAHGAQEEDTVDAGSPFSEEQSLPGPTEPDAGPEGTTASPDSEETMPVEAEPDPNMFAGYETVVVGDKLPEDPFESNRSISIVDKRDLQEISPRTTPEALWGSPGVFVQQTNHGGGAPILRGMVGPQNLILVDGVRLNNSVYRTGPLQYLNLIDPLSIERIEVLRGPGSVLYGSDAMGGVIQVIPISPGDRDVNRLTAGGGMLGRYASADHERTGHVDINAGYRGFQALGGATYQALENLTGGRGIGEQPYSGYDRVSTIAEAKYRVARGVFAGWSAEAVYLFSQIQDAGRTDKLYDSNSLQFYDNTDHLAYGRLNMFFDPVRTSGDLTLSYQFFFERKDDITVDSDFTTPLSTTRDLTDVNTLGTDLKLNTEFVEDRLHFLYGGMWYRDWADASRKTRLETPSPASFVLSDEANYPEGSTYDNFGAFAMLEGDPLSTPTGHVLRLSAGYRLHGAIGRAPERLALPDTRFSYIGNVFMGAIQYLYDDKATAALTFSQGFRAPNLNESIMLGDTGKFFHVPNSDLKPEQSSTLELVARGRIRRLTIGASGYISLIEDLIKREATTWEGETIVDGKDVAWNVNGGQGLLLGVEGEAGVDFGGGFSMSGHLTYTWGEEDIPSGPDMPLSRIPPLFGQLAFRYDTPQRGEWRGYIETYVRAAGKQDRLSEEDESDPRIPEGGTPGWWTWNVGTGLVAWEHLALGLRVENLVNEQYKYHGSGIWAPGTNAVLTVKLLL